LDINHVCLESIPVKRKGGYLDVGILEELQMTYWA
jgi:hypothetical protein